MSALLESPNILVIFIGGFPGETAAAYHVQRICRGLQLQGWRPMVMSVGFSQSCSSETRRGFGPTWGIGEGEFGDDFWGTVRHGGKQWVALMFWFCC